MELMEYIIEDAFIVVPVLWVLGVFLKKTPYVADWVVIWILLLVGIALTMALLGTSVISLIQGIIVTGAAVMGHQLLKQTLKGIDGEGRKRK